ncbi:MAG: hypothetical protein QOH10_1220 [Actinomycetota bacterium]|nr:hypothetical protein [Actinomycetota bacterium]
MTTAATPKRSFKRTVASTVEERSPRFLLGSLALAMVISLLAGLGIGIKIGEHNKTNQTNAAVVKPKPSTTPRRAGAGPGLALAPLKGTVVRRTPRLLVISKGKTRIAVTLLAKTRVEVTRPAQRSDIKAGSRVVFVLGVSAAVPTTTKGTGTRTTKGTRRAITLSAKEILVVTGTRKARMGSLVTAVTADSMTFKLKNGKSLTISTVGATVSRTIPSTRAKLVPGQHVLIKWFPLRAAAKKPTNKKTPVRAPRKLQRIAVEIVAVPAPSAFA